MQVHFTVLRAEEGGMKVSLEKKSKRAKTKSNDRDGNLGTVR